MIKSLRPAFFLALACLPLGLAAGPPYQTDDPEPPDPGQWELFCAAFAAAEAGGTTGAGPQFEANYGATKDLQLSLSAQMSFAVVRPGALDYGLGDCLVGAKYRFLRADGACPDAAFFPQMTLPTGDATRSLGNGAAQTLLPLWFQEAWGPWTCFGGGGYWFNPGSGNRNWTFVGTALQRDFGEHYSLGGELFFHSAAQTDDVDGLGSNLAFLWHLTKDDHLICSAGRDLVFGNTTFTGYLAYQKLI
jgi:hypothetical protein